jgi:DnaA N-terminal domain
LPTPLTPIALNFSVSSDPFPSLFLHAIALREESSSPVPGISSTSPVADDGFPEGLGTLEYAKGILAKAGIVQDRDTWTACANAISTLAEFEGLSTCKAAETLLKRALAAQNADKMDKPRFWFVDGRWKKPAHRSTEATVGLNHTEPDRDPPDPIPEDLDVTAGQATWKAAMAKLERVIIRQSFDTWFKPLRAAGIRDAVLYVRVPTVEFKHIGDKYQHQLREALPENIRQVEFRSYGKEVRHA